jgi:hypothetical protein
VCCACGTPTVSGLYTRKHESELLCKGDHGNPAAWSPIIESEVRP